MMNFTPSREQVQHAMCEWTFNRGTPDPDGGWPRLPRGYDARGESQHTANNQAGGREWGEGGRSLIWAEGTAPAQFPGRQECGSPKEW